MESAAHYHFASFIRKDREVMASACQYEDDKERGKHYKAIQMLSEKLAVPEEEIRGLYETILCSLKEGARIKDYLVILVSRQVRDSIKRSPFAE